MVAFSVTSRWSLSHFLKCILGILKTRDSHLLSSSLSLFDLYGKKEPFPRAARKWELQDTKGQHSYRTNFLQVFQEQHSQKCHNMFFFFRCRWLPIQSHTILRLHCSKLYFQALYLCEQFHCHEDTLQPQQLVSLFRLSLFPANCSAFWVDQRECLHS